MSPPLPTRSPGGYRQHSVTVHGSEAAADARRLLLIAQRASHPTLPPATRSTLGQLLPTWLEADHPWKPSTRVGYRSVMRALLADPIAAAGLAALTPHTVRAAVARWQGGGASLAVVGGRFRVLRSALSWAYDERLLDHHPARLMRGPARPSPRRPLTDDQVSALLTAAELGLLEAEANHASTPRRSRQRRHRAEQDLLLVRLAADTGARCGELAALRIDDLTGRTLRIDRAVSAGQITVPKSGRGRTPLPSAPTPRRYGIDSPRRGPTSCRQTHHRPPRRRWDPGCSPRIPRTGDDSPRRSSAPGSTRSAQAEADDAAERLVAEFVETAAASHLPVLARQATQLLLKRS